MAARQKALDILKTEGDDARWRFSRGYPPLILLMANRAAEAEQWARDSLAANSGGDYQRAALIESLVAQGKLAEADKVVGELVGQTSDATFARAWVALRHGKPATAERRLLGTQLAELRKSGKPLEIVFLEVRVARVAVAAGDPGARNRLSQLAVDLRKRSLDGLAILAEREAVAAAKPK